LGVLERPGVGPFLTRRLYESLGLDSGTWHVGLGADVHELEDVQALAKISEA
jgi:hypothetical protein